MKILITGASSYVGARIFFDLKQKFNVVGTYNNSKLSNSFIKLDITNEQEVNQVISKNQPDIIIHVAANANARLCEANPKKAIVINEKATQYIVDAANKIGAKVIYMSTSRVINPQDIYAKTKFNSEQIVKQTKKGWIILRPSYILGFSPNTTNDRPFNRLLKNLDEGKPAIYDTSWKFQVTYIGHISEIIETVINRNINCEILPIIAIELKSRYDTAKDILTPFNIPVTAIDNHDISIVTQDNLNKLFKLKLPVYSYKQIIKKIIDDIKHRDIYKLV